jgi:hypothetical protein
MVLTIITININYTILFLIRSQINNYATCKKWASLLLLTGKVGRKRWAGKHSETSSVPGFRARHAFDREGGQGKCAPLISWFLSQVGEGVLQFA